MARKSNSRKNPEYNTEDTITNLAKRIRALRIEKGYSNYENFAFENNISRAQYGRYEKGQDIRFSSLLRIINAFDMTLEEFFSEGFDVE